MLGMMGISCGIMGVWQGYMGATEFVSMSIMGIWQGVRPWVPQGFIALSIMRVFGYIRGYFVR